MNAFEVLGNERGVGRHHWKPLEGILVMQVEIAITGMTLGLVCHGNDPLSRFIKSAGSVNFYSSICRCSRPQQLLLGALFSQWLSSPSRRSERDEMAALDEWMGKVHSLFMTMRDASSNIDEENV